MKKWNFTVVQAPEDQLLYGLSKRTSDKAQMRDIPALSAGYYAATKQTKGEVFPFFVLSKNYNKITKTFDLFVGSTLPSKKLEVIRLPRGTYVKTTVQPAFGLMWGAAIGRAKRYFYTKWLPQSGYEEANMEYEYHTALSTGEKPQVTLFFAVRKPVE